MSSTTERKLAAIMFTDIAGYTALSAKDENTALELLDKQKQILTPIIEEFNGILHKQVGDGLLFTFQTVTNAVRCGIKIQEETKAIKDLNLRIGIHQGEITLKDGDALGDDVNVASRIESYAAVGGIAISGKVQQDISSLPEFETKFISQPALKGVKQDVKIYCITSHNLPKTDITKVTAKLEKDVKKLWLNQKFIISAICLLTIVVIGTYSLISKEKEVPSIGILVLDNYDNNTDDYLAYSLTEDLIFDVSGIGNIRVSPMQDILAVNKNDLRLSELAEKLDVKYILNGSIANKNNNYELRCNLIEAESGLTVYQKKWIEPEENLSNITNVISQDIINNLNLKVKQGFEDISSINSDAYELYLRGNYTYQNKKTEEDIIVAQNLFEESISIDSNLVFSYIKLGDIEFDKQNFDKVEEIYNKAYIISQSIQDNKLIAYSLQSLSKAYLHYGEYDSFLEANKKSNEIFIQYDDKKGIAENLELKGDMYNQRYYNEMSNLSYNKAREYYELLGYKRDIADITMKIASAIDRNTKNREEKVSNEYNKALKLFQFIGDKANEAKALAAIGTVHNSWWMMSTVSSVNEREKIDLKSIEFLLRGLEIYLELNDTKKIIRIYRDIAWKYYYMEFQNKALEYANKGIDSIQSNIDEDEQEKQLQYFNRLLSSIYKEVGNEEKFLEYYNYDGVEEHELHSRMGGFYVKNGNFIKANKSYYLALEVALKEKNKSDIIDLKTFIANAHFALKEYNKAEELILEIYNIQDSLKYSADKNYNKVKSKGKHLGPLYYERGEYEIAYTQFLEYAREDSISQNNNYKREKALRNTTEDRLNLILERKSKREVNNLISQYFCLNKISPKNTIKLLELENRINTILNSFSYEKFIWDSWRYYSYNFSFSNSISSVSHGIPFLIKAYKYYLLIGKENDAISLITSGYNRMIEMHKRRSDEDKKYFYDIYWNKRLLEEWEEITNF